jgi:hypothetical protein
MLPVKKIYIDTRYKTPDSISNSRFKYELSASVLLPDDTVFYIDDICIPHSWYTIETNINDKFYISVYDFPNTSIYTDYVLTLESKTYTGADLATELQAQLNTLVPAVFTVTYLASKHVISIVCLSTTKVFKVLTYNDIIQTYNINDPNDTTDMFKLTVGYSPFYDVTNPFISGPLSLQPIRNIYISSPNLGNFNTMGPRGEWNIIKKVPVSADYNQMIFDQVITNMDYLDCSRQSLKTIEFHLKDVNGNFIPLHGANVSFSIVFNKIS